MRCARRGFTLVECMLACAIISLLASVILVGITVAGRVSRQNADRLSELAEAEDQTWRRFNLSGSELENMYIESNGCYVIEHPYNGGVIRFFRAANIERMGERKN